MYEVVISVNESLRVNIMYACVTRLLFLIKHLYSINVWFGEDKRTNFIKIEVQKRSDYVSKFY